MTDRGIKMQKELAMGFKGAKKEAGGKPKDKCCIPAKSLKCGGMVKKGKK